MRFGQWNGCFSCLRECCSQQGSSGSNAQDLSHFHVQWFSIQMKCRRFPLTLNDNSCQQLESVTGSSCVFMCCFTNRKAQSFDKNRTRGLCTRCVDFWKPSLSLCTRRLIRDRLSKKLWIWICHQELTNTANAASDFSCRWWRGFSLSMWKTTFLSEQRKFPQELSSSPKEKKNLTIFLPPQQDVFLHWIWRGNFLRAHTIFQIIHLPKTSFTPCLAALNGHQLLNNVSITLKKHILQAKERGGGKSDTICETCASYFVFKTIETSLTGRSVWLECQHWALELAELLMRWWTTEQMMREIRPKQDSTSSRQNTQPRPAQQFDMKALEKTKSSLSVEESDTWIINLLRILLRKRTIHETSLIYVTKYHFGFLRVSRKWEVSVLEVENRLSKWFSFDIWQIPPWITKLLGNSVAIREYDSSRGGGVAQNERWFCCLRTDLPTDQSFQNPSLIRRHRTVCAVYLTFVDKEGRQRPVHVLAGKQHGWFWIERWH